MAPGSQGGIYPGGHPGASGGGGGGGGGKLTSLETELFQVQQTTMMGTILVVPNH